MNNEDKLKIVDIIKQKLGLSPIRALVTAINTLTSLKQNNLI